MPPLTDLVMPRALSYAHTDLVFILAARGPQTDAQLARHVAARANPGRRPHSAEHPWRWQTDSGVRTRRSELRNWGIVLEQPDRALSAQRRPTRVWGLADPMPLSVPEPPDSPARWLEHLEARRAEAAGDLVIIAALTDLRRASGARS